MPHLASVILSFEGLLPRAQCCFYSWLPTQPCKAGLKLAPEDATLKEGLKKAHPWGLWGWRFMYGFWFGASELV